jgi:Protein of unknown function (DUF3298)
MKRNPMWRLDDHPQIVCERKRSVFAVRSPLIAVTAAAIIAAAVGCGTSSIAHQTASAGPAPEATASPATTSPASPSTAAQGQSACTDFAGTVRPDHTCQVRSETASYKIDMSFPLDYPDMHAVTDFLKQDRGAFLDLVARFGPSDRRGRPYQYVVTAKSFRSGTPESGTQSLVLKIDNDTGLAHEGHPDTTFRAFNFDLGKRARITFDTLFKPGARPLEVLNPIVQRELHAPTADLDENKYQNFALTDDAVIFFFGQDQVVPDNGGPKKVTVPRTELASLLA